MDFSDIPCYLRRQTHTADMSFTKVNLNANDNKNSRRVFRPQIQQDSDFLITLWKNLYSQEDVLLLSASARP